MLHGTYVERVLVGVRRVENEDAWYAVHRYFDAFNERLPVILAQKTVLLALIAAAGIRRSLRVIRPRRPPGFRGRDRVVCVFVPKLRITDKNGVRIPIIHLPSLGYVDRGEPICYADYEQT